MIVWSSGTIAKDEKVEHESMGIRSWRWVLDIEWGSIDLRQEIFCTAYRGWHRANAYFNISVTPHCLWGSDHTYYDGPHCSFSVGYVHFNWSYWWCEKCMPTASCT